MDDRGFEIREHTQVRGVWDSLLCFSNTTRSFCRRTTNHLGTYGYHSQVPLTHSISPHLCGTLEVKLEAAFFLLSHDMERALGGPRQSGRPIPETSRKGASVPRLHGRTYRSGRRGLLRRFTSDRLPRASRPHVSIYQRPLSSAPFLPFLPHADARRCQDPGTV